MLPATILSRLRTETREQHLSIEGSLKLMDADLSLNEYALKLERFYGYYKPIEAQIFGLGSPLAKCFDLQQRRKTPLLDADLMALGRQNMAQLSLCRHLPSFNLAAEYFGCMYVLEGATLGGQVISRHLHAKLSVTPQSGGRFFNGYGQRTGVMWGEFRRAISAVVFERDDEDAAVISARTTFATLQHWLEAKSEP